MPVWRLATQPHLCRTELDQACADDGTNPDEDQTANEFATFAVLGADPAAQLQADQDQSDADGANDDRG